MRIAIVGGGVSGLVAAHLLRPDHEITVFEAAGNPGGHVRTVTVPGPAGPMAVDTGFIVYNERNYANFTRLLARLGVATQPSTMSFSVRMAEPELEYNGSSVGQLFSQRRNLVRPWFYRMLADIVRFHRVAPVAIRNGSRGSTMGELVEEHGFSAAFRDRYLVPMAAAIWSSPAGRVLDMPADFVVQFFENHGMLTVDDRPEWRVITGGSQRYVDQLVRPFRERLRLGHAVSAVRRFDDRVEIDGERFDQVVLACHSDQALRMLADASPPERAILGAIPYQANDALLHTDTSVLPRRRRAWGAWNYHGSGGGTAPVALTYNMNQLQSLEGQVTWCVTLNGVTEVDPSAVAARMEFHHPVFTPAAVAAQRRWGEISGVGRTHFCGAYWGHGFHEDGVNSALAVGRAFGASL